MKKINKESIDSFNMWQELTKKINSINYSQQVPSRKWYSWTKGIAKNFTDYENQTTRDRLMQSTN